MHRNYYLCGNVLQIGDLIWADGEKICIFDIYYEKSEVNKVQVLWIEDRRFDPLGKINDYVPIGSLTPLHAYFETYLYCRTSEVIQINSFIVSAGQYLFLKDGSRYYVAGIISEKNHFFFKDSPYEEEFIKGSQDEYYISCFNDDFQPVIFGKNELTNKIEYIF